MTFPSPSPKQAKILWLALTALGCAVILAFVGAIAWGAAKVLQSLSSVLLPIALAGILAYLIDPVVDFFESLKIPRVRAIFLVFFLAIMLILIMAGTVVPRMVVEVQALIDQLPDVTKKVEVWAREWLQKSPFGAKAKEAWVSQFGENVQGVVEKVLPVVYNWFITQAVRVASWFSLVVGLALVPVYVFYFLLEKRGIQKGWTDYLPVQESKVKSEIVFILNSINDYLILFFRGQVLVALCDGVLLTIGFTLIGLNYSFLLGMVAGMLSVVPYLGVAISIIPTLILAVFQFGDWLHPLLVLAIFAVVQLTEGLVISPKIMGDRVGLHPLTIIIAVMIGTTLLGGIIGGILAIPLTAALRVLMFRYIWKKPSAEA